MERLSEELLNNEGPVCKAIKNLRGALLFHTQKTWEALDCFRNVLQDDEENLNALLNCKYVCNKLLKESDVNKYEEQIQNLLSDENANKEVILARFNAELGYAMSFEFTFDSQSKIFDYERFQTATNYFEKALAKPDFFTVGETCQWHFFGARAYHRLYDRLYKRQKLTKPGSRDYIVIRCIELFHFVIHNTQDVQYKAKSWCLLGSILFKVPITHTHALRCFIEKCKLRREVQTPSLCFEKARQLSPNDAKLACRHARMFLTPSFRDLKRAISILDESIEMDNTKLNWFAFSSRAIARMRMYEDLNRQPHNFVSPRQANSDSRSLKLAKADLEVTASVTSMKTVLP